MNRSSLNPGPHRWLVPLLLTALLLAGVSRPASADVLTGHVVGPDGKPIVGASVIPEQYGLKRPLPEKLTTDATGSFTANADPETDGKVYLGVYVYAPGLAITRVVMNAGDTVIRLGKARTLHGSLVDEGGKSLPAIDIELQMLFLGGSPSEGANYVQIPSALKAAFSAKTSTIGTWSIGNLPETAVNASVALADPNFVQDTTAVPLGAGAPAKPVVARPAAFLIGKVIGADGMPRPGITVNARQENFGSAHATAKTAEDGTYQLGGLPTTVLTVSASELNDANTNSRIPAEVASQLFHVQVTSGSRTKAPDIQMRIGTVIQASMVDAETSKPIGGEGIYLTASGPNSDRSSPGESAQSDASGHFALRVPSGNVKFALQFPPKGYLLDPKNPWGDGAISIDLIEGQSQSVVFRLSKALTLSGTAVDESGKPVAGVEITSMEQGAPERARTDAQGRWMLGDLKPGTVRIVAKNDFEVLEGNEIPLPPRGEVKLVVRPFKIVPLVGRVVGADGKPIAGANVQGLVHMVMGGGAMWMDFKQLTTDAKGEYTLTEIRPENSKIDLTIAKTGYKLITAGTITLQSDRLTLSDTVLQSMESNRTISGKVVSSEGAPVPFALVAAATAQSGAGRGRTDSAGRFTLNQVPRDEETLLAAYGSSFARSTATAATLRLEPAIIPCREVDVSRAEPILMSVVKNAKADDWTASGAALEIAPESPDLASKLALEQPERSNASPDWMLTNLIQSVVKRRPDRIMDWALPLVAKIGDVAQRMDALCTVAIAADASQRALVKDAYAKLSAVNVPKTGETGIRYFGTHCVLASRLGQSAAAQADLDSALALLKSEAGDANASSQAAALAQTVAAADPAYVRAVIPLIAPADRARAYSNAIPVVASYSGTGARGLLEDMIKDPGNSNSIYKGRSAISVVRALAKADPSAAAEVAETNSDYPQYRRSALIIAARSQTNSLIAAKLYHEAAEAARFDPGQIGEVAAAAYETDPKLGKAIFADAKEKLEQIRDSQSENYDYQLPMFAYYYSRVAPGESRLLLEAEIARMDAGIAGQKDDTGEIHAGFALAMRVFDLDRALALCDSVPDHQKDSDYHPRVATKIALARYMLETNIQRRREPLRRSYDDSTGE